MSELLTKLETAMSERRAELINQPLARIWGELAIVAEKVCREQVHHEQMVDWGLCEEQSICSVCDQPQFQSYHGMTCTNGHGGADAR